MTLTHPLISKHSIVRALQPENTHLDLKLPEMEFLQGERSIFYTRLCKKANKWPVMVKMDPPKLVPPGTNFLINKDPPELILLKNLDPLWKIWTTRNLFCWKIWTPRNLFYWKILTTLNLFYWKIWTPQKLFYWKIWTTLNLFHWKIWTHSEKFGPPSKRLLRMPRK